MRICRKLGSKDKGFTETIIKFAFLPKYMSNGDLIWLEKYLVKRMWQYSEPNIWRTIGLWNWKIIERTRVNKNEDID